MNTRIRTYRAIAIIIVVGWGVSTASAGPRSSNRARPGKPAKQKKTAGAAAPSNACKPWVCGVSQEQQDQALQLFQDGNKLLELAVFGPAVAKYRIAIEIWDHPAIHYNMALAHNSLGSHAEAYHGLEQALRYNGQGLRPDERRQARKMIDQLRGKVGQVQVVCEQSDVAVTFDGESLVTCPGTVTRWALIGERQIVASKPNHVQVNRAVTIASGKRTTVEIRLIANDQAMVSERHWPFEIPVAITATGVALGVGGLALHVSARGNYDEYTRRLRIQCAGGCEEMPADVDELYSRARRRQVAAFSAYALAGIAMLGGLTMIYYNRERSVESEAMRYLMRIQVTPVASSDGLGVLAAVTF